MEFDLNAIGGSCEALQAIRVCESIMVETVYSEFTVFGIARAMFIEMILPNVTEAEIRSRSSDHRLKDLLWREFGPALVCPPFPRGTPFAWKSWAGASEIVFDTNFPRVLVEIVRHSSG